MKKIFFTIFLCITTLVYSQVNTLDIVPIQMPLKEKPLVIKSSTTEARIIEGLEKVNGVPVKTIKLNPKRAGLYSAVLPGLGQFYNKKYWKIPIVWAAVGAGVGIVDWNNKQYKKYREYYFAKLNNIPNEFVDTHPWLDKRALGNAQDRAKRQRDYAIAITGLIYILNILDAVVDAHLYESRKDPDLVFKPSVIQDQYGYTAPKTGFSLCYRF